MIMHTPGTEHGELPVSAVGGKDTQTCTHRHKKRNDEVDLFEVGFCRAMLPLADPVKEEREISWMWLYLFSRQR